jgi:hypothetical protein
MAVLYQFLNYSLLYINEWRAMALKGKNGHWVGCVCVLVSLGSLVVLSKIVGMSNTLFQWISFFLVVTLVAANLIGTFVVNDNATHTFVAHVSVPLVVSSVVTTLVFTDTNIMIFPMCLLVLEACLYFYRRYLKNHISIIAGLTSGKVKIVLQSIAIVLLSLPLLYGFDRVPIVFLSLVLVFIASLIAVMDYISYDSYTGMGKCN